MENNIVPKFYGISANLSVPVSIEDQKLLFSNLFIDPKFRPKNVKEMVENSECLLNHESISKLCQDDIWDFFEKTNTEKKCDRLVSHMLAKTKEWIHYFSLPTPREILNMCTALNLTPSDIACGIYIIYLEGNYKTEMVLDFLEKFSPAMDEELLEDLFDKYKARNLKSLFLGKGNIS